MPYIIGIVAIAIATIFAVPALKGPINRYRLEANEKLNAEYVVDNYKIEYVKMNENRGKLAKAISDYNVEIKVVTKKIANASSKVDAAKSILKQVGTTNMQEFNRAKNAYELAKTELDNYTVMTNTYAIALKKLQKSLSIVDSNMAKAKLNIDTLAAKKTMLDTIKSVNKSIENITGIGDMDLAVNVEKLDDESLRESIKLEAFEAADKTMPDMSEAEAKAYLQNLK